MSLRILIVEDEVLIAETIKLQLEEQGHIIQDICISYDEAISAYQQQRPDLVILDIRLYGSKSGIDVATYLCAQPQKTPFIYLTSQHDRRIADLALETTPYGYLAKPIQKESLWTTVAAAYKRFQSESLLEKELTIYDGQKKYKIKEREIVYIKSDHIYANILLANGKTIITRKPLSHFLQLLKSNLLIQCHRSYIVNKEYIDRWNSDSAYLVNGEVVPISRSKRQILLSQLQN